MAETVAESLDLGFGVKKLNRGWFVYFVGILKDGSVYSVQAGPHETIKEALVAAIKAVKPTVKEGE